MTRTEILQKIPKSTCVDMTATQMIIDEFMDSIMGNMAVGGNVYLRGFSTFEIFRRKAKIGRNIIKSIFVEIPKHNIHKFKFCDEINARVK